MIGNTYYCESIDANITFIRKLNNINDFISEFREIEGHPFNEINGWYDDGIGYEINVTREENGVSVPHYNDEGEQIHFLHHSATIYDELIYNTDINEATTYIRKTTTGYLETRVYVQPISSVDIRVKTIVYDSFNCAIVTETEVVSMTAQTFLRSPNNNINDALSLHLSKILKDTDYVTNE